MLELWEESSHLPVEKMVGFIFNIILQAKQIRSK